MSDFVGSPESGERGKQECVGGSRLICNDVYLICYALVDWQPALLSAYA